MTVRLILAQIVPEHYLSIITLRGVNVCQVASGSVITTGQRLPNSIKQQKRGFQVWGREDSRKRLQNHSERNKNCKREERFNRLGVILMD